MSGGVEQGSPSFVVSLKEEFDSFLAAHLPPLTSEFFNLDLLVTGLQKGLTDDIDTRIPQDDCSQHEFDVLINGCIPRIIQHLQMLFWLYNQKKTEFDQQVRPFLDDGSSIEDQYNAFKNIFFKEMSKIHEKLANLVSEKLVREQWESDEAAKEAKARLVAVMNVLDAHLQASNSGHELSVFDQEDCSPINTIDFFRADGYGSDFSQHGYVARNHTFHLFIRQKKVAYKSAVFDAATLFAAGISDIESRIGSFNRFITTLDDIAELNSESLLRFGKSINSSEDLDVVAHKDLFHRAASINSLEILLPALANESLENPALHKLYALSLQFLVEQRRYLHKLVGIVAGKLRNKPGYDGQFNEAEYIKPCNDEKERARLHAMLTFGEGAVQLLPIAVSPKVEHQWLQCRASILQVLTVVSRRLYPTSLDDELPDIDLSEINQLKERLNQSLDGEFPVQASREIQYMQSVVRLLKVRLEGYLQENPVVDSVDSSIDVNACLERYVQYFSDGRFANLSEGNKTLFSKSFDAFVTCATSLPMKTDNQIAFLGAVKELIDDTENNAMSPVVEQCYNNANALLQIKNLSPPMKLAVLEAQVQLLKHVNPQAMLVSLKENEANPVNIPALEVPEQENVDFIESQKMLDQIEAAFQALRQDVEFDENSKGKEFVDRFVQLQQSVTFCRAAVRGGLLGSEDVRQLQEKTSGLLQDLEKEISDLLGADNDVAAPSAQRNILRYMCSASACMRMQIMFCLNPKRSSPVNPEYADPRWDLVRWLKQHFDDMNGEKRVCLEYTLPQQELFLKAFTVLVSLCDPETYAQSHGRISEKVQEDLVLFFRAETDLEKSLPADVRVRNDEFYYVEEQWAQVKSLFSGENHMAGGVLLGIKSEEGQSFETLFGSKDVERTDEQNRLYTVLRDYASGCDTEFDVYLAMFDWEKKLLQSVQEKERDLLFRFQEFFGFNKEEVRDYHEKRRMVDILHSTKKEFYNQWVGKANAKQLGDGLLKILEGRKLEKNKDKAPKDYDGNFITQFFSDKLYYGYMYKKSIKKIKNITAKVNADEGGNENMLKKQLAKAGIIALDAGRQIGAIRQR